MITSENACQKPVGNGRKLEREEMIASFSFITLSLSWMKLNVVYKTSSCLSGSVHFLGHSTC